MASRLVRLATHPLLLVLLALAMVYTLGGFSLAPWLVERYAPRFVMERTGHALTLGDVQFNPFLFRLDVHDAALRAPSGETVAAFERLLADLQVSSLVGRAWTFRTLRLDRPTLNVVVEEDGRLNLAALLPENTEPAPQPARRRLPRVVVQDGAVSEGSVSFADRSQAEAPAVVVAPINVAVNGLTTVPDREGRYRVSAELPDGARLAWSGDVSLQPLSSAGELTLEGLHAGTIWPFVAERVPLPEPAAVVSASGRYRVAYARGEGTVTVEAGQIRLADVRVPLEQGAEPALTLDTVSAEGIALDLAARELRVGRLTVHEGDVAASVNEQGELDWAGLAGAPAEAQTTGTAAPWRVSVQEALVEQVAARYADASRRTPLVFTGELAHLGASLTATVGGSEPRIAAERLNATLTSLVFRPADADDAVMTIDAARLEQAQLDTAARRVRADTLVVDGGEATLARSADGTIRLLEMLSTSDEGAVRRELRAAAQTAAAQGRPWEYALGQARIADFGLTLRALDYEPALEYALTVQQVALGNVASDSRQPMRFHATVSGPAGGTLEAGGDLAQDLARANANVTVAGLSLVPMQPVLDRYARVALVSGVLGGTFDVHYGSEGSGPALSASGGLQVSGVRVNEEGSGDRLLAWKALTAQGVRLSSSPPRLSIDEVRLQEPGAKVVISAERRLNLADVLRERASSPESSTPGAPLDVSVQRVLLDGGTVDFADHSLVLPFATTVESFNGTVLGVTSDRTRPAEVQASGSIEDSGAARLSGSIRPFAPTEYTDLRAEFERVDLPPLSPYSATFAGRKIASGQLWLDLRYRIDDGALLGENKILLTDFKLGERVEAPNALDLPLDLAVALLADSEGRINLAVPVRGDVDNPQFSYGRLIADALGNVVKRIVSAPFRALGALVDRGKGGGDGGGEAGGSAPASIAFAPGEAALAPPERAKLDEISKVLRERPQLQLVVQQPYDARFDRNALRADAVRRAVAAALGRTVKPDAAAPPVDYTDAATQRALERLLAERQGEDAPARFAAEYERVTGRTPDRVNPALAVFGRASADTGFYAALHERLLETQPLPEGAAAQLAARRAQAIERYLVEQAGLGPARVRIGEVRETQARAGEVAAELDLDVLERG